MDSNDKTGLSKGAAGRRPLSTYKKRTSPIGEALFSDPSGIRTPDTLIKSQVHTARCSASMAAIRSPIRT